MHTESPRHAAATNRRETLPDAFLRLPQVLTRVPVGRSTLWLWVREGRFPKPIKLGPMTTAWKSSDVDAWIKAAGRDAA